MSVLTSPGNGVEARLANATPNQSLVGTLRRACARALNVCILDTLRLAALGRKQTNVHDSSIRRHTLASQGCCSRGTPAGR